MLADWIDIVSGARPSPTPRVLVPMLAVFVVFALLVVFARAQAMLFAAAVGLVFIAAGGSSLFRLRRARRWVPHPAEVVASALGETIAYTRSSRHVVYYPRIRFRYAQPSGELESSRLTPVPGDPRSLDRREIEQVLARFPVGAQVMAHVDPRDPRMSALLLDVSGFCRRHLWARIGLGVLLILGAWWAGTVGLDAIPPSTPGAGAVGQSGGELRIGQAIGVFGFRTGELPAELGFVDPASPRVA